MGPSMDKLFLEVAGRPLIAHTWARFETTSILDEIVIVVRVGLEEAFQELADRFGFKKPFKIVEGGKERQDSVWNGLQAASRHTEMVVIQDGARPCTSEELVQATINAAREVGAAVAAQRVTDTIKESDGGLLIERTIDRSRLWSVQTPQTFRYEVICRALEIVRRNNAVITDDTAACELIGQSVKLVESMSPNPKATSPADLPYIELLLRSSSKG